MEITVSGSTQVKVSDNGSK